MLLRSGTKARNRTARKQAWAPKPKRIDFRLRACVMETLEARRLLSGTFDISGVQPAALDQPRINAFFRFNPTGGPLTATDPSSGTSTFNVQAFLDTGTSEVLLSQETSSALNINPDTYQGQTIQFSDTGIAGSGAFNVSQPLYFALASSNNPNADDPSSYTSTYNQTFGPVRAELNPTPADPTLGDPLDIIGMPGLQNKTMVVDARPLNDPNNFNLLNTYVYNPGTPYNAANDATDPGIAPGNFHVKVSEADFSQFAAIDPAGAPGATFGDNPFIGPNPLNALNPSAKPDNTPGITVNLGPYSATGSFLFDTGAAASFISQNIAAQLHVHYKAGTYASNDPNNPPDLVDDSGKDLPNQFSLPIGGIGGTINASGFFLDSLVLPTVEGQPIRFVSAPVVVLDVTVQNPVTQQQFTLDGDFGMNFLVASTDLNFSATNAGAFNFITFDQQEGLIGLQVPNATATPTVLSRHVFYNDSLFDGNNRAANAADAGAIAWDKSALLPGQTASFANYTSYSKGINGIMVDVSGLPSTSLTASDFTFKVGNSSSAANWTTPTATPTITVLPGIGADGSNRVEITFPDGAIKREWLQVTMKADANTGLAAPDVFYFGNSPGEVGNSATNAMVNVADVLLTRRNLGLSNQTIESLFDFNRDGTVDASDVLVARGNLTIGSAVLQLITPAAASPAIQPAHSSLRITSARTVRPHRSAGVWLAPLPTSKADLSPVVRVLASLPGVERNARDALTPRKLG